MAQEVTTLMEHYQGQEVKVTMPWLNKWGQHYNKKEIIEEWK